MDLEIVNYILDYFPRLMTTQEAAASRHSMGMFKLRDPENYQSKEQYDFRKKRLLEAKLLTADEQVLNLLKDGLEQFRIRVAERIMEETPDQVFFNCCPECNRLARTALARQCRYCSYSWHHRVTGYFRIEKAIVSIGRAGALSFFGTRQSGTIEPGMKMDLVSLGITDKPLIESCHENIYDPYSGPALVLQVALDSELHAYLLKHAGNTVIAIEQ